jgi:hypothetical protein
MGSIVPPAASEKVIHLIYNRLMQQSLPKNLEKYFWGDNLEELNWHDHQKYITQTLLNKGDQDAIKWLFNKLDKNTLKNQLSSFKLNPKSENFWHIYLS